MVMALGLSATVRTFWKAAVPASRVMALASARQLAVLPPMVGPTSMRP